MGRIGELVTSQLSRRELVRSGGWESWEGEGEGREGGLGLRLGLGLGF